MGIESKRVDTETLLKYFGEIGLKLADELNVQIHCVRFFEEKETHGDLDILIKIDHTFHNTGVNLKDWVIKTFNPKAIINNGGVISWEYNNFQIDFIPVKESNWEVSKCFFSYDPTGNLMGKVIKQFSFDY